MTVENLRPQFTLFVVDTDIVTLESTSAQLKMAGYQPRGFPVLMLALTAMRETPPHMLILYLNSGLTEVDQFLREVQSISRETLVFVVSPRDSGVACLNLVQGGLAYDYLLLPAVSTLELVQKLDRAVWRLYFQYENEQLRDSRGLTSEAPTTIEATDMSAWRLMSSWFSQLGSVRDVDASVQAFMDGLSQQFGNAPVVYFKYLPHYLSLIVSASTWLPLDKIRGIGIDLKDEDPNRLAELFREPQLIAPLRELLAQVFKLERYSAFGHYLENEILGMFVVFNVEMNPDEVDRLQLLKQCFDLVYRRNILLKDIHALEVNDGLTGIFNRRHFRLKLEDEVSRARRIHLPVSMLCLDIDEFHRLNHAIGFAQADAILKTIASLLKRTARASDILARIGPDEIVLLMPHTDHLGAVIKAERIRRMIESAKFPSLEGRDPERVTVSIGVSEYPSFCADADALLRTTDEALAQIKSSGTNKVCVATAPQGFQPDFAVIRQVPAEEAEESL